MRVVTALFVVACAVSAPLLAASPGTASVRSQDAPSSADRASTNDIGLDASLDASIVEEAPASRRAVTLLPLVGDRAVTSKQARGTTAQVRTALKALVDEDAVRLLPATSADDGVLRKCATNAACFADVARSRGADRLGHGTVAPGDGGLRVTLNVAPDGLVVTATLDGTADDAARLDRLVREAFAPETLRGVLRVEGQPGDVVEVDGRRIAAVTTDRALDVPRLREGTHALRVTRPESKNGTAYDPYAHDVTIRHGAVTTVNAVLLPRESTAALGGDATTTATTMAGPSVAALVSMVSGGVLLAGGVTCGVFSLLDQREVEQRAEDQQLVFPRDEEFVTRGTTLAMLADVLYGAGALAVGGGVALWLTSSPPTEEAP
jgi:hypothetical protein